MLEKKRRISKRWQRRQLPFRDGNQANWHLARRLIVKRNWT
jgi:hypothetical protein